MNDNDKVFYKELPNLIKKYKGMYVTIKNGVISKPYKTHSEAFKATYTTPDERFNTYKIVLDEDLKNLRF